MFGECDTCLAVTSTTLYHTTMELDFSVGTKEKRRSMRWSTFPLLTFPSSPSPSSHPSLYPPSSAYHRRVLAIAYFVFVGWIEHNRTFGPAVEHRALLALTQELVSIDQLLRCVFVLQLQQTQHFFSEQFDSAFIQGKRRRERKEKKRKEKNKRDEKKN